MKKSKVIMSFALLLITALLFAQSSTNVYITTKGKKFHTKYCKTIKNSSVTELSREQALQMGYTPCGVCKP